VKERRPLMENEIIKQIRSEAADIFKSSVEAVNPYHAVKRFVRVEGERLVVGTEDQATVELDLSVYDRILLVGGGKATAPMAKAMEELLGERINKGLINVKYGFGAVLALTEITEANHPLPDSSGVKGTTKILGEMGDVHQ